jgi:hypothetical protein
VKDVIEMASKAGGRSVQNKNCNVEYIMSVEALKRFEDFIRTNERKELAEMCDEIDKDSQSQWPKRIATMILARENP